MNAALLILLVLVVLAITVAVAVVSGRPERTATHLDDEPEDSTSDRFYRGVDRPAGPDAEDGPA